MSKPEDQHVAHALELANDAIEFDAGSKFVEAARCWQAASDYADQHLQDTDIFYWIKSGLGAALFEVGDYPRSIAVSKLALDWCLTIKQPLPSLTIAKSHLRLGEAAEAVVYVEQAHRLIDDGVFDQLDPHDRETMKDALRLTPDQPR